jgi:hypothetical protein
LAWAFNDFLRKREKKEDFLQTRFSEFRTGLVDALDFTSKRFYGRTSFYFSDLDILMAVRLLILMDFFSLLLFTFLAQNPADQL